MPMSPELSSRTARSIRKGLKVHVVDVEKLKRALDEEPFVREGFELLKEASMLLVGKESSRSRYQSSRAGMRCQPGETVRRSCPGVHTLTWERTSAPG